MSLGKLRVCCGWILPDRGRKAGRTCHPVDRRGLMNRKAVRGAAAAALALFTAACGMMPDSGQLTVSLNDTGSRMTIPGTARW